VELYRVRDVGYVDPVQREARAFGKDFCPSAALDLNGDGKVELLAEIELDGFESVRPRLRLVLWANAHRFELRGQPEAAAAHARAERAEREAALAEAQRGRDVREAMRLGIELAALAQLDGADARGQVAQLDQALRGMVLEPAQAAALLGARERIFRDFGAASPAAPAAGTPAAADVQEEQDRLGRAPGLQKSQG
jgi:hypothetical protein